MHLDASRTATSAFTASRLIGGFRFLGALTTVARPADADVKFNLERGR
jgi:hypothetical protein